MKNKYWIFAVVLACIALAGCSEAADEPLAIGKSILLSATVPNGARAVPTTTATMKEFVVYAFTEGDTLMNGVKVIRTGGLWTYSPEAYWPVNPVNFYAFSPDISQSPDIEGTSGGNIPDYLNPGNVDLLYSVRTNVTQQAAPVLLNFRHALSRVSVLLSSSNQRITVKIGSVSLCNFYMQGTFNFPTESTLASASDVIGNWTLLKNFGKSLLFYAPTAADEVILTHIPTDYTLNNVNYSYVIPQPLKELDLAESNYSGNYIQVDCEIFDTATGAKLWPNSKTPDYMLVPQTQSGRIVYPVTTDEIKEWKPGYAYIYNIAINNPNVLDKIEFDVTVDDYYIDEI